MLSKTPRSTPDYDKNGYSTGVQTWNYTFYNTVSTLSKLSCLILNSLHL